MIDIMVKMAPKILTIVQKTFGAKKCTVAQEITKMAVHHSQGSENIAAAMILFVVCGL